MDKKYQPTFIALNTVTFAQILYAISVDTNKSSHASGGRR